MGLSRDFTKIHGILREFPFHLIPNFPWNYLKKVNPCDNNFEKINKQIEGKLKELLYHNQIFFKIFILFNHFFKTKYNDDAIICLIEQFDF